MALMLDDQVPVNGWPTKRNTAVLFIYFRCQERVRRDGPLVRAGGRVRRERDG